MSGFLIIGAGPTGLGAAHALHKAGAAYTLLERSHQAGGLAASFTDNAGFTWDIGGHVQFSHYPEFDAVMDSLFPPSGWLQHERSAWAWMHGRFVPYPVQQHLGALPASLAAACRAGLPAQPPQAPAPDFAAWMVQQFGAAFTEAFMRPYNRKVWAHPPETMNSAWIADRIAPPTQGATGWGPNNRFRFPARGGTGHIWNTLAATLPDIHYHRAVTHIAPHARSVTCADGSVHHYEHLISTLPLDTLCRLLALPGLAAAGQLAHAQTHIVGLGLRGACPPRLQGKSWIYFPEENCPFYRATVFSNYSPHHAPQGHWSLMAETSASAHKPVNAATLVADTVRGCLATGLIASEADIMSRWHHHETHGYPVPTLGRDAILARLMPQLEAMNIYSRGRFGGWKYEVSNQDHSFMQGAQLAARLLHGTPETVYRY